MVEQPREVLETKGAIKLHDSLEENRAKILEDEPLSVMINISDLPKIWQEHIAKRKAEGKLPAEQNSFDKFEILRAASSEQSFTSSEIIDKIFDRVAKEKIDLKDLPKEWQDFLRKDPGFGNAFDNVTVEYLLSRGARAEDIAKVRERIAQKKRGQEKVDTQIEGDEVRKALAEAYELSSQPILTSEDIRAIDYPTFVPNTSSAKEIVSLVKEINSLKEPKKTFPEGNGNRGFWGRSLDRVKSWFSR